MHVIYLSNCCFAKEDELYAAAWLGCCCLRHPEGNVRVDDRLYAQLYSFSTSVRCSAASSTGVQDPAIIAMKLSGMKMFKSSTFLGLSMGCLNGLTA
jgi:hypothetical protein